jgi:hypothetical protein
MGIVVMLYEVWKSEQWEEVSMFPVSEDVEKHRKLLSPGTTLIRIFIAASWNEAMTNYYDHMNWEPYVPMED